MKEVEDLCKYLGALAYALIAYVRLFRAPEDAAPIAPTERAFDLATNYTNAVAMLSYPTVTEIFGKRCQRCQRTTSRLVGTMTFDVRRYVMQGRTIAHVDAGWSVSEFRDLALELRAAQRQAVLPLAYLVRSRILTVLEYPRR